METLRMYFKLLGIALKSMMQFRADFLIGILGVMGWNIVNLLAISVILGRFYDLAGWTVWEIVFMYGLWMVGNSIFSLLFFHLTNLEDYLIRGSFDLFLVRPLSPFLMLLTVEVNINGVADVIFGAASLGLAISNLHLQFSGVQWLYMGIMLVSAALLELGITLVLASIAFWTTKSAGLIYAVNQVNWNMTRQYPLEMFGRGFRMLVTGLIPFAFLNYYPARWLLGKTLPGDRWYFLSFLAPLVTLAVLGLAAVVWQKGIRRYNSTGS
jgi:ABC-2 type transport system permease protein